MPVSRPAEKQPELLFQWPSPLAPGDSVTVADGDSCVSMQFGQVLGVFAPGSHSLPAQVPDGVELWFCTTRRFVGRKFGGNAGLGSVFGDYAFQVVQSHLLVTQVASIGQPDAILSYLDSTVLKAMGAAFGKLPPSAAIVGDASAKAAAQLQVDWAALGVSFLGFGQLTAR